MVVYIEYVVLDNMIINSIILCCVNKTIKQSIVWYRIVLSALIGTICAIVSTVVPVIAAYFVKLICVVAMSLVSSGKRRLFWHVALTVVYTFLLGGAIIGLMSLLSLSYSITAVDLQYQSDIPISIYVLAVALCVVLAVMITKYINTRRATDSYIIDAVVTLDGQHIACKAMLDSGNTLTHNQLSVCFAFGNIYNKTANAIAKSVLAGKAATIKYSTVSSHKQAVAVQATVTVQGRTTAILLALPNSKTAALGYDILLNASFLEEKQ